MFQTNLVYVTLNLHHRLLQNYWKTTVSKNSNKKPYCCNPLTVAEGKKLRLVLDLRHVNKHIKHNKFRYENLSALPEILNKGNYFTTFDQTSGYHYIEMHPEHRKFLGIQWTFEDGSTRYFQFYVLHISTLCIYKSSSPLHKTMEGEGY